MARLFDFEGKTVVSIDQAELDALKEDPADTAQTGAALDGEALERLLEHVKQVLGEQVNAVTASKLSPEI